MQIGLFQMQEEIVLAYFYVRNTSSREEKKSVECAGFPMKEDEVRNLQKGGGLPTVCLVRTAGVMDREPSAESDACDEQLPGSIHFMVLARGFR